MGRSKISFHCITTETDLLMGTTVLDKTARILADNHMKHSDTLQLDTVILHLCLFSFDTGHKSHPDVPNHTCPPILAS